MRTRFYNARILTMNCRDILEGEIWVKDKLIEYIGTKPEKVEGKFEREIDIKKNLIMPGFKNAHTHSAMTFARSYADDLPLDTWLNKKIFPMEAKLKKEHYYYYSLLAYMEYISSGITANFDMYYEPEEVVRASNDSGMRTVLCGAVNNFKESVEILEDYYQKYNSNSELITYILGFHAEYTTDISVIQNIGKLANKYKAPVFVHNSETQKEVIDCVNKYGLTPTQLFEKNGLYNYGGGGFHCIYLDERDIEIFLNNNLYAVVNTCSNLKLASGIAPVYKYLNAGMNLALGTDGASSNNALDIFREMYITTVLQKVICQNPAAIDAYEILRMATVNGAKAMGLDLCTTLNTGNYADFIVLDLNTPNMQPENNLINTLVYSGGKQNVIMTVINGKILYDHGCFMTIDKEKVFYYSNIFLNDLC